MTPRQQSGTSVVSRADWLVASKKLLVEEKTSTRQRDALSAERPTPNFLDLPPPGRQDGIF